MKKHAFLIIAHNDFPLLQKLITLLDDPCNDIYLHIDKKADKSNIPDFSTKHSKLQTIPSITVNWGGHSQIFCELNLLKCATQNVYYYYHLLSGADLPIKNNRYIQAVRAQNIHEIEGAFQLHKIVQGAACGVHCFGLFDIAYRF